MSDAKAGIDTGNVETEESSRARAHVEIVGGPGEGGAVATAPQLQQRRAGDRIIAALEADEEIARLVVEAAKAALTASTPYYNKHEKKWELEPDGRTRLQGAEFVMRQLVGLPLQRIEAKTMHATATVPPAEMLKKSPALREAMKRMLAQAEAA